LLKNSHVFLMSKSDKMNILIATAEATPLAKSGGLADVAAALPIEWKKMGQNPLVIMPKYRQVDCEKYGFVPTDLVIYVPMGNWMEFARLWYGLLPGSKVPVYLIENGDYFDRDGIYGNPIEYDDNDRRFIFFSRAVLEAAKALNFKPDVLHAHDYHAAFTLAFLKSQYRNDPLFANTAGVYTIHNLAYQGWFDPERAMQYSQFGTKEFYPNSWFEHNGSVNAMKTGIMFADKVTTVSPNYAQEIRYPYFSEGMQDVLNHRAADLVGILNGVNYDEWNPEVDENIYAKYNADTIATKRYNKHKFLKENGLKDSDDLDLPLVGMITRLTEQKGIDLVMNKIELAIATNQFRFTLLGSGNVEYEEFFHFLAAKYPGKAVIYIGYNEQRSHLVFAASDFLLIPSRFEPCGLTQLYALKYGTIPIVRMTGGLADTVHEYNYASAEGNGFLFYQYNADDMDYAIRRAVDSYQQDPHWGLIRQNAMNADFSSRESALKYLQVFNWALNKVR
jgi:starch synthase